MDERRGPITTLIELFKYNPKGAVLVLVVILVIWAGVAQIIDGILPR